MVLLQTRGNNLRACGFYSQRICRIRWFLRDFRVAAVSGRKQLNNYCVEEFVKSRLS